jgi:hypothetical protein
MLSNNFTPKNPSKYNCYNCDFTTCNKKDFTRHLNTKKHKNQFSQSLSMEKPKNLPIQCICGKNYKDNSGLWRHKKICNDIKINDQQQLVEYLMKENSEFKQLMKEQNKQMMELAKNSGNNITNNNQQFNLNFFLNETCKNAMNIMDYISQLQIGIKDLEETARLGYAAGISKIFIEGLNNIDINDRPIHCSDSKRETLYIKNNNEWNKETEDKTILTNAIKHVTHKNMKMIPEWIKENPDYNDSTSKTNDKYLKLVMNSMSGSSEEEQKKNISKIISNVAKEVVINK